MQLNVNIKKKQYDFIQSLINKKKLVEAEISSAFQAALDGIDNIPEDGHVIGIKESYIILEVPDLQLPQLVKE